MFKVNKKDTSKTTVSCCSTLVRIEQTLHLVWVLLRLFFEKQVNVCCGIGSILMSITLHIHNAAKQHSIANYSCHRYFKKFEGVFSSKQHGTIRTDWKILSCIFYHLCIVITILQVATSISVFSTTRPSLTRYRKHEFYIYLCININLIISFGNHI